jgi:hypothetical protein
MPQNCVIGLKLSVFSGSVEPRTSYETFFSGISYKMSKGYILIRRLQIFFKKKRSGFAKCEFLFGILFHHEKKKEIYV